MVSIFGGFPFWADFHCWLVGRHGGRSETRKTLPDVGAPCIARAKIFSTHIVHSNHTVHTVHSKHTIHTQCTTHFEGQGIRTVTVRTIALNSVHTRHTAHSLYDSCTQSSWQCTHCAL